MEHYTRSVGITPDQSEYIVTDGVHDPISNKLCRGGAALAASTPMPGTLLPTISPAHDRPLEQQPPIQCGLIAE